MSHGVSIASARSRLRRASRGCLALVLGCLALGGAAQAETYPARPVKIVVSFGPGSVTDMAAAVARLPRLLQDIGVQPQ